MKQQTKSRGFTIVELLIVIVIIAILAAITIVAYNGIQARANTSAAQSAANTMVKKIEAYNALNSGYPTVTTSLATELGKDNTTTLNGTGITLSSSALTGGTNGKSTLRVELCTNAGSKVYYYDYTSNAETAATGTNNKPYTLGTPGTCTTATP